MGKGSQIAIAVVTVFAGLAWLLGTQTDGTGTFRYYATVDNYLGERSEENGSARGSRVHGFVLAGSIDKNLPGGYVDFVIQDESEAQLPVRYEGIDVPDLFKDGAEVVVEGRLAQGVFVAERVMAKCPSKYEAREEPGAEV